MVHPVLAFQQNQDFDLASTPRQVHPLGAAYHRLDWPQRFGKEAFWTVDPGQSALAVSAGPMEVSFGTENAWWGPARRYPLLLGNSAAGYPHARIGLSEPVSSGIGSLRVNFVWGRLDESSYYDAVANDARLLSGAFAEFQPAFLPGLVLGISGLKHTAWTSFGDVVHDALSVPYAGDDDESNGLLSFTASWLLPESGFEVYAEWARDDYWQDFEDLITEPDHAQAYLLGFEKLVEGERATLRVAAELAHLNPSPTGGRRRTVFYRHRIIRQGHTHRGQLLGSATGPSSNAQYFAVDLLRTRRTIGVYAERIRRDDRTYFDEFASTYGFRGHDLEWTLGLQGTDRLGPLTLQWDGALGRRKNRTFIGLDGVNWDFLRETSLALTISAWWLPSLTG